MKRNIAVILAFAVILSIASFLPVTQKTTIGISASFDNTLPQVMQVENWKNWYPAIKQAYRLDTASCSVEKDSLQKNYTIIIPSKKYLVRAITKMSYEVDESDGNSTDYFAFTVFPGDGPGRMKIFIVKKSPFIRTLFSSYKAGENAINGLKQYLEDPTEFYGFNMAMGKIRDSIIASTVFKINKKELFLKIHTARQNLLQYIAKNGLIKTGHISISYTTLPADSMQLTVGIPVNKTGPGTKAINCLALPAVGRVLAGNYEGSFHERRKLYAAMSKYVNDHQLSAPAESFERYLDDSIPASDSSLIRIELNYPVF